MPTEMERMTERRCGTFHITQPGRSLPGKLACMFLICRDRTSSLTWQSWYRGNSSTPYFWSCVGGRCRRRRWRADMPPAPETWWWSASCLPWGAASPRGGTEIQRSKVKVICFVNWSDVEVRRIISLPCYRSALLESVIITNNFRPSSQETHTLDKCVCSTNRGTGMTNTPKHTTHKHLIYIIWTRIRNMEV